MKSAQYQGDRRISVGASEPIVPGPAQARLDVSYCGICGTDIHIYHGAMDARVQRPLILGHEASATVAEVGSEVTRVAVGDRVAVRPMDFGEPSPFDKGYPHVGKNLKFIGIDSPGGMQSSWTVPAHTLHKLPDSLSFEHGALIEPAAVACHDVRLGEVTTGEMVVVIGGGPIGLLIGLVCLQKGARVILSEVNETRLRLAGELGMTGVNPTSQDLPAVVDELSGGAMADCVFEVSGSAPGVEMMTELPNVRGRIVMVAIHPEPRPLNLFKFFWSELRLIGVRLYEEEDFEAAIRLAAEGALALDRLITQVLPIDDVQQTFERIDASPDGIKYLIDCRGTA
ncbi:MAG: alcohol dehydrogenase catalytic domain-containing protein [Gemmatimonadetes bacterium]|jgi:(R,R)-butanediol dehydrogenase / meso-butanediol dehydrogenase / diacetyl reductase|nr:alcohol dehydrogenase catalytic domain-containing protein [Gemmatimonadota bacterium]MBT6147095.1 alcohol dehydrogenase catalytic domain-containing protein [Gemmatimonadota bacterium]MBT7862448.1 alcohol dehydrogenase catalytic domain-containing protein [Gemmatimonadota bacterium]